MYIYIEPSRLVDAAKAHRMPGLQESNEKEVDLSLERSGKLEQLTP